MSSFFANNLLLVAPLFFPSINNVQAKTKKQKVGVGTKDGKPGLTTKDNKAVKDKEGEHKLTKKQRARKAAILAQRRRR